MTPGEWIALAALMCTIIGAALYIGMKIGAIPGEIAAAIEAHARGCANYEPNSSVRIMSVPGAGGQS